MIDCPIYIVTRDRVSDLTALVSWLEEAGHERIVFLDNASTYEPLLEYLGSTPHEVVRLSHNWGSRVLWIADTLRSCGRPTDWFVVTDPDVIPTDDCPKDLVAHLHELLCRYSDVPKAGPGFVLDDVAMPSLDWERCLVGVPSVAYPEPVGKLLEPGVFESLIDTTFALYRPCAEFEMRAIRCGAPYLVRHMPWYRQSLADLPGDDRYYLEHADRGLAHEGTTWEPK